MKNKISYWITLIWGFVLGSYVVYIVVSEKIKPPYYLEIVLFSVAVVLVSKPSLIVNLIEKYSNDKIDN